MAEMKKKDDKNEARQQMKALLADAVERIDITLTKQSHLGCSADCMITFRGVPKKWRVEIEVEKNEVQVFNFEDGGYDPLKEDSKLQMYSFVGGHYAHKQYDKTYEDPADIDNFLQGISERFAERTTKAEKHLEKLESKYVKRKAHAK